MAICLALLAMLGPGQAKPPAKEGPKVMRGFVLQGSHEPVADILKGPNSGVIETPEQLASFAACIPEHLPHKKNPAPPNPDPLRKSFKLDFSREMMVIVVHHDTISAYPKFQGVEESGQVRVVKFDLPGRPAESRPYGWGVYTAVILPKVAVPTELKLKPVPSEW